MYKATALFLPVVCLTVLPCFRVLGLPKAAPPLLNLC